MSLFRCGGGGGTLEETVLWTNPSPTSDFAAQAVTLSDNIGNYDYIKVDYLIHKSYSNKSCAIYRAEDVLIWMPPSQINYTAFGVLGGRATNDQKRSLLYSGPASIYINNCVGFNNTTSSNQCLTPLTISGLKFSNRRPSAVQTATGSFTSSASVDTDVVIGFKPKYLCILWALSGTVMYSLVYDETANSSKQIAGAMSGSTNSAGIADVPYNGTINAARIKKLNDDGFTVTKVGVTTYGLIAHYFAIG